MSPQSVFAESPFLATGFPLIVTVELPDVIEEPIAAGGDTMAV
jgi:hypothetical protein